MSSPTGRLAPNSVVRVRSVVRRLGSVTAAATVPTVSSMHLHVNPEEHDYDHNPVQTLS